MVWGHKDFVRELHRQLVEIETLRKKLNAASGDAKSGDAKSGDAKSGDAKSGDAKSGDAKSSLGKLEESQRQLLRKIDELFTTDVQVHVSGVLHGKIEAVHTGVETGVETGDETGGDPPSKDGTESPAPKPPTIMDAPPEYLLACLQSMLQPPGAPQHLVNFSAEPHVEKLDDLGVGPLDAGEDEISSILQQRCCVCDKLLVSSLLAGEQIVQKDDEWHHESCKPSHDHFEPTEGDILWQPSVLN